MKHPVVLIADQLSPAAVDALGEGVEIRHCDGTDRAVLLAAVRDADALLVRSGTRADAEVIAAGTRLKVIGRAGVGLDNVDVDAATRAGVLVVNTPTANIVSAAEMTCALLLAAARNLPQAGRSLKQGSWERSRFTGTELSGKVLGIVGLGRIGALVAERLAAFGMEVISYDPYVAGGRPTELGIEMTGLDDLLTRADFVTVHLPRTPETVGLIGAEALAKAKPTAYFVNVARGGIIDEAALTDALRAGRIAGAALDVFENEPPADSPLLTLDNVVATPHLGASTHEAQEKAGTQVAESVALALKGAPVPDAVNAPRPFAGVSS
ncbi:hypothetical protein GCM10010324_44820 [Streptomyces hiroshimensis]|uniref:Phosphoglycerate dehydrogenase n=1 Tax=Streptomyces hiroshimensis TaxID=66424 RepID=A0ABQ2YUG2_9ACTN|nr:hypothetical protein GCM10010324_44820 [Streptomyces hiroshimensis]